MTDGTTFANALTTMFDDLDDSQTLDRHVNLTCGFFRQLRKNRCVSESLKISTLLNAGRFLICLPFNQTHSVLAFPVQWWKK